MYESLFNKVLFPFYEGRIRRRQTTDYLREYEHSQWLTREELLEQQKRKLTRLVKHAAAHVPAYRELWGSETASLDASAIVQAWPSLPVVTKTDLSAYGKLALCTSALPGRPVSKATGGSTGEPFRFQYDAISEARRQAVMWRGYGWAGMRPGTRSSYLWASPLTGKEGAARVKEMLYHAAFNRSYHDCFHLSDDDLERIRLGLNRRRPKVVVGYVSALVQFARWIRSTRRPIHSPASVIAGAETLHDADRELLCRTFDTKVFNTYGSREFMLIASECAERQSLHTNDDHLLVEVLDEQDQPVVGRPGKVVVTDLHNYRMPLIRYETGDLAIADDTECGCARGLGTLQEVIGRSLDVLLLPDGSRLPGEYFPHLFKDYAGIRKFQVVQEDVHHVDVSVVLNDGVNQRELLDALCSRIRADHDGIDVRFHVVDDIPLTPSGKLRVTISRLAEHS